MAESKSSYFLNISGPEGFSERFEIPTGITNLGRQYTGGIDLNHPKISRVHARFERVLDELHLTDLGSTNGTELNGQKLEANVPVLLKHDDVIDMGPYKLQVEHQVSQKEEPGEEAPEEAKPVKKTPARKKPSRKKTSDGKSDSPPPPQPPADLSGPPEPLKPEIPIVLPGQGYDSRYLIHYLPGIYHTPFFIRFLGIFEATLLPIEWLIDHFDLFLSPSTSPAGFLNWLANWFNIGFDDSWTEEKKRTFLAEAGEIYSRLGTKWALSRVIEIYTGQPPVIDDLSDDLEPFTFRVGISKSISDVNEVGLEYLINDLKPAHTAYELNFQK